MRPPRCCSSTSTGRSWTRAGAAGGRWSGRSSASMGAATDSLRGAVAFGGMTDRAIARAGLLAIGAEPSAEAIDAVLRRPTFAALGRGARRRGEAFVHAGHRGPPSTRRTASGAAVGPRYGQRARRGRGSSSGGWGSTHRFAFGGFGCDDEARPALLRAGRRCGGPRRSGAPLAACRVVVIGDTPKDVAAAHAIGAECIAVATGSFTTGRARRRVRARVRVPAISRPPLRSRPCSPGALTRRQDDNRVGGPSFAHLESASGARALIARTTSMTSPSGESSAAVPGCGPRTGRVRKCTGASPPRSWGCPPPVAGRVGGRPRYVWGAVWGTKKGRRRGACEG